MAAVCNCVLVSNRWSEETTPASLSHQVSPIKRRKMVLTLHAPSPPKSPETFLNLYFSPFRPTHPRLPLSPSAFLLSIFPPSFLTRLLKLRHLLSLSSVHSSFLSPSVASCVPVLSNYCTGWRRLRWHASTLCL